jgi:hypothetical protein
VCQEIFGNENQTVFFKLNFNPLELTFVRFFGVCLCKMEWSSIFKKSGPKICFLPLKLALRVEHSYMAHSPISTLFHTVRKRLTTDLPTWRKLSYLHKEFCNARGWWEGLNLQRVSLPHWIYKNTHSEQKFVEMTTLKNILALPTLNRNL